MVQRLYTPSGDRRHVISLLDPGDPEKVRNADGSLPPPSLWKSGIRAKVEPLQGRELLKAQQIVQEVTHKVTIHYLSGVLSRMYVQLHDGRKLGIQAIEDPDERKFEMHLLCVERDDGR